MIRLLLWDDRFNAYPLKFLKENFPDYVINELPPSTRGGYQAVITFSSGRGMAPHDIKLWKMNPWKPEKDTLICDHEEIIQDTIRLIEDRRTCLSALTLSEDSLKSIYDIMNTPGISDKSLVWLSEQRDEHREKTQKLKGQIQGIQNRIRKWKGFWVNSPRVLETSNIAGIEMDWTGGRFAKDERQGVLI